MNVTKYKYATRLGEVKIGSPAWDLPHCICVWLKNTVLARITPDGDKCKVDKENGESITYDKKFMFLDDDDISNIVEAI